MNKQIHYLALGDSYTIGEGVDEHERWPVLFAKELRALGFQVAAPEIIAKTGWTTDELKTALLEKAISKTYHLVTLSIGVNNQYRGLDLKPFKTEFTDLLQMALKFAGHKPQHVRVISIPDWGLTPFAQGRNTTQITAEIAAFNQVKKEACQKEKIPFVDITALSKSAATDSSLLAEDGLHYSGKMHQLWVDEIIKIPYT